MKGKLVGVDCSARKLTVIFEYAYEFDDEFISWIKKKLGSEIDTDEIAEWQ